MWIKRTTLFIYSRDLNIYVTCNHIVKQIPIFCSCKARLGLELSIGCSLPHYFASTSSLAECPCYQHRGSERVQIASHCSMRSVPAKPRKG